MTDLEALAKSQAGAKTTSLVGTGFHHSPHDFNAFDPTRMGERDDGDLGRGVYLSTDPAVGGRHAQYTHEFSFTLNNPLRISHPSWKAKKRETVRAALGLSSTAPSHAINAALIDRGHDGVVLDYSAVEYPHQEIMLLNHESPKKVRTLHGPQGVWNSSTKPMTKAEASHYEKYDQRTNQKMAEHNRSGGDVRKPVRKVQQSSDTDKRDRARFAYRKATQALKQNHPLTDDNGDPTPAAMQFKRWGFAMPKNRDDLQRLKAFGERHMASKDDVKKSLADAPLTSHAARNALERLEKGTASEADHDDLGLPPLPGTAPIPEGHVRLFHQTQAAHLEGIRSEGIHIRHARGIEGPKAIYADEKGFYGKPGDVPTVEFHVPKEHWKQPFVRTPHVTPDQIVAIHEPWHHTARYIHAKVLDQALAGDFDHLKDRPSTDKSALEHLQARYGKSALGKSLLLTKSYDIREAVRNQDVIGSHDTHAVDDEGWHVISGNITDPSGKVSKVFIDHHPETGDWSLMSAEEAEVSIAHRREAFPELNPKPKSKRRLAKGFERNDDYRPPRSLRLVAHSAETRSLLGGKIEHAIQRYDIHDSLADDTTRPIGQVSVNKQTRVSDGHVSHTARFNGDYQRDHGLGVQGLKSVARMVAKIHPELREFAFGRQKAGIRQAINSTERVPYLPGMTSEMRAERAAGNSKVVLQTAREAEDAVAARGISPYQQKTHPNPFADLAKSIKLGREDRSTQVADGWHHGGSDESPMNPHKRLVRAGEAVGTYKLTEHAARLNHFYVDEVQAVTRGGGRAAMQHIIDHADRHGVSLNLMANPLRPQGEGKKMTTAKLRSWYRGFGFRPKQGDLMVRTPVRSLDRPMDGGA